MKLISRNDLFDNAFKLFDDSVFNANSIMKSDIYEEDNNYIIEMDVPGINKEDIKIDFDEGYLTISATKEQTKTDDTYIKKERYYGEYKRSFYIGNVDESNIKANYNNGTLVITFPKEEITKDTKKQITID